MRREQTDARAAGTLQADEAIIINSGCYVGFRRRRNNKIGRGPKYKSALIQVTGSTRAQNKTIIITAATALSYRVTIPDVKTSLKNALYFL